MKTARRLPALMWPIILLCAYPSPGARADDEDLRALRQKVDELTATVRQLQDRIKVLERDQEVPWVPAARSSVPDPKPRDFAAPPPVETTQAVIESTSPAAKASVDDKIVVLRKTWRQISGQMNREQVRETLGPPSKEMLINGKVVWYYVYSGLGAGSIFFKDDGHVSSSQPPISWTF